MQKIIIVGSGITGIVLAEQLASKRKKVKIIEKRDHIGGNCYDYKNKNDVLIHKYGPHIFHTNNKRAWEYLSQFTKWIEYTHEVLCKVNDKLIPLPFNFNSLYKLFNNQKAKKLEIKLKKIFPNKKRISILKLRKVKDKELKELSEFIYKNIFVNYTQKQWGMVPEKIDKEVIGRVPVILERNNYYFHDRYQGIPKKGYTRMFQKMLKNKNIQVVKNTDYFQIKNKINYDKLIYTGPIDKFFNYKYGKLNYRKLKIKVETKNKKNYQPKAVVNYPSLKYDFTRITEFNKLCQKNNQKAVIGKEYTGEKGFLAWPTLNRENRNKKEEYYKEKEKLKNIYFIGRLAEYNYYDMD